MKIFRSVLILSSFAVLTGGITTSLQAESILRLSNGDQVLEHHSENVHRKAERRSRRHDNDHHSRANRDWSRDHANWAESGRFKTRRHHRSHPVVPINARLNIIQLKGLKRHARIYEAYAELGNGTLIALPELRGHIVNGGTLNARVSGNRYVKNLILQVAPGGHRRAYVQVNYKSPRNSRRGGDRGRLNT